MSKLTKEQKQELDAELRFPWGTVELICDGRRISLQVQRWKGMTFRVVQYIDGVFKYAWCSSKEEHPEQKFLRKSVRPNVTPAKRRELEKALGKRYVAKHAFFGGSTTCFYPDWATGKAAINHLCKVCAEVSIAPASKPTDLTLVGEVSDGLPDSE